MPYQPKPLSPEQWEAWRIFDRVRDVMIRGDAGALTAIEAEVNSFPHGVDPALQRHWLTNAIDAGAKGAVAWMIERRVDVSYVDDEGYTALISTLYVTDPDARYSILKLLLEAGSRHDLLGQSNWTAAHYAAFNGDVDALKILKRYGADLCIATEDLGSWSTPAIVAERAKKSEVLSYLRNVCGG